MVQNLRRSASSLRAPRGDVQHGAEIRPFRPEMCTVGCTSLPQNWLISRKAKTLRDLQCGNHYEGLCGSHNQLVNLGLLGGEDPEGVNSKASVESEDEVYLLTRGLKTLTLLNVCHKPSAS